MGAPGEYIVANKTAAAQAVTRSKGCVGRGFLHQTRSSRLSGVRRTVGYERRVCEKPS